MNRRGSRHPIGRIARARSAEVRGEIDLAPLERREGVAGEPLTERALRQLDPEILRDDVAERTDDATEDLLATRASRSADVPAAAGEARPAAHRAARRALMLGCWSVFGFVMVVVLAVTVPNAFGIRDLTVLSGSMEPTIHTGDVVVEREISPLDARLGDVVSFKDPEDASILITHRVQSMVVHDDVVSFVTKGDANTGVERWKVSGDGQIGKVEYHVPRLGILLFWMRGRLGRIVLVVLPALVLGAYELVRIWRPKADDDDPSGDDSEASDSEATDEKELDPDGPPA
jgi:signal peptidase